METKEEPDSEKTPAKSKPSEETVNGGTETKSTPKAVSEKKSQSKTKAKTPVSSTNGKKEASSSASKSKRFVIRFALSMNVSALPPSPSI